MAEDLIIARFQADITDYRSKLLQLESELNKLSATEKKTAEDQKKVSNELATASQKRTAALKNEEAELKRLQVALKQAFTAPEINKINGQINSVKSNISALKGETSGLGKVLGGLGGQFAAIGAGVAAAFSVQAVIQFASASIDAFLEAEANASRLKNALNEVGQDGEIAFARLIEQSETLAQVGKTVFTDDDIQRAQAQLANYGLTADEIERLIPKLADYASATQQNIVDASAKVGNALLGQGKEFKKYGVIVSATATTTENFNSILDGLGQFEGRAAKETETLTGQLAAQKREVEELQESVGGKLAPAWVKLKGAVLEATLSFINFFTQSGRVEQNLKVLGATTSESAKLISAGFNTVTTKFESKEGVENLLSLVRTTEQYNEALKNGTLTSSGLIVALKQLRTLRSEENGSTEEGRVAINLLNEAIKKLSANYLQLKPAIKEVTDFSKRSTEELLKLKDASQGDDLILIERELKAREKAAKASAKQAADAKKAQEEINKISEENLKNQEALRQQFVKSQIDLINKESDARILALSKVAKSEKEFNDAKKAEEIKNITDQLGIGELNFEERSTLLSKLNDLQVSANLDSLKSTEDLAAAQQKLAEDNAKKQEQILKDKVEAEKKAAEERIKIEQAVQQAALQLASEIIDSIFATRKADLQRSQEAETEALQTSREKALSSKRLTEAERERINNEFAAKEQALRKKQFEQVKKESTLEAIIKGALAVVNALASSAPPYNYILAAAVAAATALEIATIQSQKYAKGTKKAKGGMATVGEEGPEFMYVPGNAKILTAKQTRQHSRLIDAMYDGHLDKIIQQDYILPALQKQKSGFEKKKEQNFSNNLAKSLIFNGLTGNEMERIRKRGTDINNIDELVEKLSSVIERGNDIRRRI